MSALSWISWKYFTKYVPGPCPVQSSITLPSHCHPLLNPCSLPSQNHGLGDAGRHHWSSIWSNLSTPEGSPRSGYPGLMAFEHLHCYPPWAAWPFPVPALSPHSSRLTNSQESPGEAHLCGAAKQQRNPIKYTGIPGSNKTQVTVAGETSACLECFGLYFSSLMTMHCNFKLFILMMV